MYKDTAARRQRYFTRRRSDPREVSHWIYFRTAEGRRDFAAAAREMGFNTSDTGHLGVMIQRTDSIRSAEIHEVVGSLLALARQHGGKYDGWETSAEKITC